MKPTLGQLTGRLWAFVLAEIVLWAGLFCAMCAGAGEVVTTLLLSAAVITSLVALGCVFQLLILTDNEH